MSSFHVNPNFHTSNQIFTYRVPPIHSTEFPTYRSESITCPMQSTIPQPVKQEEQKQKLLRHSHKHQSENIATTAPHPTPRRGRKSTVPPEQREQLRRLKKQNMERRRRACISDKMNALHSMAMSVVGINPNDHQKVEKADILGICYTVLEGIAKIADERPELRSQLHGLRSILREHTSTPPVRCADEQSQSSVCSEEMEDRACTSVADSCLTTDPTNDDKENQLPQSPPALTGTPNRAFKRSQFPNSSNWQSTPSVLRNSNDSGYPSSEEKSFRMMRSVRFQSPFVKGVNGAGERSAFHPLKVINNRISPTPSPSSSVWRPYLDD